MIKIAAIQMRSEKALVDINRKKAVAFVKEAAANGAKLICLPELWVSGYGLKTSMFHQLAEHVEGTTVTMFQQLAKALRVVLIVPFPEREELDKSLFISAAIINVDGKICGIQRKSLIWGTENKTFLPGEKKYPVYKTAAGNLGVLICYDIEFPEPARLLALQKADLIVVPSVWSIKAQQRWDIQLPARALDNSVYVLGVNAVSEGVCGKSKFISPRGTVLKEGSATNEGIIYGNIDMNTIQSVRNDIPYMKDYPPEFTPRG